MKYRRLGKSGLKVSELSFGSWVTFGDSLDDELMDEINVALSTIKEIDV
jgi:aryl-alcohol dehydrogenase-like predicted oxidoreductase